MLKFFVYSTLLFLSACGTLSHTIWSEDTQTLLNQHQYAKALQQIKAELPFDKTLYKHTQNKARLYRNKQIVQLEKLIQKKQWGVAKNTLINLELSQPAHSDWLNIDKKLINSQAEEYRILNTRLTLKKAKLLSSKIDIAQFHQRSVTGPVHWYKKESILADEKLILAEELLALSSSAIQQQDYKNAQSTYAKAIELNHELKQAHLTEQINQGLSSRNRTVIDKRQKQLLRKLNHSIQTLDFKSIHHYQSILSKAPFSGRALNKSLKRAQKLRTESAIKKSQLADALYRQRKIKEAIKLWTSAKFLDPELPEVDEKLTRSIKVQKKLQQLSRH